ncbi:MAG: AraC family transcriptional regulator [Bacteroidales bacterium]|nr:AraC family transcriptional regulator [Bacteroidales bacterium]
MEPIKYIAQNERDELWGLTVCSVGYQKTGIGEAYPPQNHNQEYLFKPENGRILSEYQLLYIVDGGGHLKTRHGGIHDIKSGDMFLLFPGEWHTYSPNTRTGWKEYWIGFSGANIDHRVTEGFFSAENPIYHVGYNETIIELYHEAIHTATRQEPYFQQHLAGIVNHILGLMFMTSNQKSMQPGGDMSRIIDKAKAFLQESVESDISMPEVAEHLNISYTTFRHAFKKYTGLSPAQYFINLKIHRAKEMLRGTSASIKEISYTLYFESPEYFATTFRKKTGMSPSDFRNA